MNNHPAYASTTDKINKLKEDSRARFSNDDWDLHVDDTFDGGYTAGFEMGRNTLTSGSFFWFWLISVVIFASGGTVLGALILAVATVPFN